MQDKEYIVRLTSGERLVLETLIEMKFWDLRADLKWLVKKENTKELETTKARLKKLYKIKQKLDGAKEICE